MNPEAIFTFVFGYLYAAASATLTQILIFFGPLLILAFLLNVLGKFIGITCIRLLRPTLFLVLLGWLGTAVHELGHVTFALLSFRRIREVKFFSTDPWDPIPGYVRLAPDSNIYQRFANFFIGLGPLLIGTLCIYLAAWGLLGAETFAGMDQTGLIGDGFTLTTVGLLIERIVNSTGVVIAGVFAGANNAPAMVLTFLYITLSIGTAMTLSPQDLAAMRFGGAALLLTVFLFNLATFWLGNYGDLAIAWIAPIYNRFYGVMIFGLIMMAILALLLTPIALLQGGNRK